MQNRQSEFLAVAAIVLLTIYLRQHHVANVAAPSTTARAHRSTRTALGPRPDHFLRSVLRRRLRVECEALARAGIDAHIFEPDSATLSTVGINALDNGRTPRVVRDSFLAAGITIAANPVLRDRLRLKPKPSEAARSGT